MTADTIDTGTEQVVSGGVDSFSSALDAAFSGLTNRTNSDGVEVLDFEDTTAPDPEVQAETEPTGEPTLENAEGEDTFSEGNEELPETDPVELTDEWTPKAANRFKQLKAELKEYRQENERLQQMTKEYDAKVAELDALAAQNDPVPLEAKLREYEQDLMFRDLESTDIYRRTIEEPITEIMNSVAKIAEENRLDVDSLVDILGIDDVRERKEKLSDFLVGVSDQDKIEVYMAARDLDPLIDRRNSMLQNVQEALNEAKMYDEKIHQHVIAQKATERQEIAGAVVNKVKEKLPFLKVAEGVNFEEIQKKAASVDPAVADPVDIAFGSVAAQLIPTLVREYSIMRKEVESLTDKLAEYDSAEPTLSGRIGDSGQGQPYSGYSPEGRGSFEDAINAVLGSH
jgi:hypothetical protein